MPYIKNRGNIKFILTSLAGLHIYAHISTVIIGQTNHVLYVTNVKPAVGTDGCRQP